MLNRSKEQGVYKLLAWLLQAQRSNGKYSSKIGGKTRRIEHSKQNGTHLCEWGSMKVNPNPFKCLILD